MIIYIQTDTTNRITDAITYEHDGYVPVTATLPLPPGLLGGAYELRDGIILYRREWDVNADIESLKEQNENLMLAIAELSMMMMEGI